MSPTEQFGLKWLLKAMTCPGTGRQCYYYDSIELRLFHVVLPDDRDGPILFYDALGIAIGGKAYHELFIRMENGHGDCSGIVEICRFSRLQKLDIQQQFLKRMVQWSYLLPMTEDQGDGSFILDELLTGQEYTQLKGIWEKFKLGVARYYVQRLSLATGIPVDLSR